MSNMQPFTFSILFIFCLFSNAFASTITFNWELSWISAKPDGTVRPVVAINGQFPLPTVNVTLGDNIVIHVYNNLGNSSATLHFHGIWQNGTTAQDGPFQVTQCGVPAGQRLTYRFPVEQPGTFFYHSHFEGQYPDGLRGAFIVHDPKSPNIGQYDEEVVLTLSDWYHDTMAHLSAFYLNTTLNPHGGEPIPYSALINDIQDYNLHVQPNKTYFLRIINFAAFTQFYLKFDHHQFTIIEVDGVYTHPRTVDTLYLAVAQRYGVLLHTKKTTNTNYAILSKMDETKFDGYPDGPNYPRDNITANVNGTLIYDSAKPIPKPLTPTLDALNASIIDDFTLVPYDNMPLLQKPTQQFVLELDFTQINTNGQNRATFNGITWLPQPVPSLFTALTTGRNATDPKIYGINANAMVLRHNEVIEVVINNLDSGAHPIHIHGHAPQLVARAPNATYTSPKSYYVPQLPQQLPPYHQYPLPMPPANSMGYDGDVAKLPAIPVRRDTWMLAPFGYTVIRFVADNPGVWFFHCHMDWHNIAGLAATFIEAPLELQRTQTVPYANVHQCATQGYPIEGNAAGNTKNYSDLAGANTVPAPLPLYTGAPPLMESFDYW